MRIHKCGNLDKTAFDNNHQRIAYPTAVGLGNFDGLHLGHMSLISELIQRAKTMSLRPIIYTFEVHPQQVLPAGKRVLFLTDNDQKSQILENTGVEFVCYDRFDTVYANMSPKEFVQKILVKRLNAKLVVAGYNYHFGHKGAGTAEELNSLGKQFGFSVSIVPPYKVKGIEVSSTHIRSILEGGKVSESPYFLGRLYSLKGKVQTGLKKGRSIGIPTANLIPDQQRIIPLPGVYITSARVGSGQKFYQSLTSIGNNPTVGLLQENVIETYILGFDNEIYETEIEVFFHKRIRGIIKFENMKLLKEQIKKDIDETEGFFNSNLFSD